MTTLVRNAYGPFLTLRNGDGIQIKPYESSPMDIDMIKLYPQGGNVFALRASNGKFMSATNGGGSTIKFNSLTIGTNEKFTFQWIPGNDSYLIWCPDGVHGLDAPNLVGQYITAYYPPGGCGGQFCFHHQSDNKYYVWAYCSDGIGPGVFWPELSRPGGLPSYQQAIVTVPETVDILEYLFCDDTVYGKCTSSNQNSGEQCYWFYHHANGDIDYFIVKGGLPWNFEFWKYVASEQLVRHIYDCEDSQPNVDCGEACRFSMRESDTHKPAKWMKRFWTVGEILDCSNSEGTSWHNDKTPCYPWSGPGFTREFLKKFSRDWGGSVGVRDSIQLTFDNLDANGNIVRSEIYTYAKGWGLVNWNVSINGVLQRPEQNAIWLVDKPKVMPDFTSVCPETYQIPTANQYRCIVWDMVKTIWNTRGCPHETDDVGICNYESDCIFKKTV